MDILKKIFPLSFRFSKTATDLIIGILIYLVAGAIGGFAIGLLAAVPIVNIVVGLVGGLLDLYVLAGIVIEILVFCKVIK